MQKGVPVALVNGNEGVVVRKLIERLRKDEIIVIENAENYEEFVDYVFDFLGDFNLWERASENNSRVTAIAVNDSDQAEYFKKKLANVGNVRIIEAYGVYGNSMEGDDFLNKAFMAAVKNKNLVLPSLDSKYRLLAMDDLIEAILRANFLSGTEGEKFLVMGRETNSEEVASVLIDKAKMTKRQVIQEEIGQIGPIGPIGQDNDIEENWKKLRWKPEVEFKDGVEEVLQGYFVRADEEGRRKKKVPGAIGHIRPIGPIEQPKNKRRFEVEVDEEEEQITNYKFQETNKSQEPITKSQTEEEIEEVEEVEKFEIKPIIKKQPKEEEVEEVATEEIPITKSQETNNFQDPITNNQKQNRKNKKSRKWVKWMVGLSILSMLYLPVKWGITLIGMKNTIVRAEELIKEVKMDEAVKIIDKQSVRIQNAEEQITDLSLNNFLFWRRLQELFRSGRSILSLEKKAIEIGGATEMLNEGLFGEKTIDWNKELTKILQLFLEFESDVGIIEARFSGNNSWLPARYRDEIKNQLGVLSKTRENIEVMREFLPVVPELIGVDGKRREYLVLLQNESELRSTGGFIGSFGILSFQDGKMLNFEVKDVYEADGQLEGHVEPPVEIRDYLGEAAWFMRDANWQADFMGASKDLEWFLEKEIGRKVDGVIGMNLSVAKAIVGVVGEVSITDYKQKINKDNLYETAEFYSESKFFPGSTQKASFLSGLGTILFEEIKNLNNEKQVKLLEALIEELKQNDVQIAMNNKEAAGVVAGLGWDGSIKEGKCAGNRCSADYTFINESNFGVNKANYFILRNIEKRVEIGKDRLSRILTINYENTAKTTNYPGGNYKNYLRVYLPSDINLQEIRIIDGDNKSNVEIVEGSNMKLDEKYGKKEIGFLVTVPVSGKRIVQIKYYSEMVMDGDKYSYLDYFQRQSGSAPTELTELVSIPKDYQVTQVNPVASMVDDKVLFEAKLDRDLRVGVEVGK